MEEKKDAYTSGKIAGSRSVGPRTDEPESDSIWHLLSSNVTTTLLLCLYLQS